MSFLIDFSSVKCSIDNLPIEIDKTKKLCGFITYSKKEASHYMMKRVKTFLDTIASTNYTNIAIVSHRGFIYMFNKFFDRRVDLDNCEMYRVKLDLKTNCIYILKYTNVLLILF